ncbi:SAM-dependent methyltransferase [Brevirhabdus pacifica]|uniref:SAM-dependent methyltransferase n=1 Tax=Brevirhabdus pacifica TaxID=1267768 RepID=A0A1U7DHS5_9RHOB|nr:class I SAM-dependent methyltransferase [Brevirhabdus pacifica]APX89443.1 SAM-dependent methyltransferase [Brevirhabdus pacifica]OWU76539.1 phospholipid methyltransferase [Loktanella sp. 22II-4b]PJJ85913.1 ubiquinone/menaquinone biosynthesis C-methylase UbiE [Brevirhabdus pacifica]
MGIYDRYFLPRLTHMAMGTSLLTPYRERVIGGARGRVLEIGVGSGLNLPLYGDGVEAITAIDPSAPLLDLARDRAATAAAPVDLIEASAEDLPLSCDSFDMVTVTWTLCSVRDPARVLAELRRVLRPGGALAFVEHGRAPDPPVRRWQDRLTPFWRRCAGNCHLNRPVAQELEQAGFRIERLDTGYAKGPRPMTFMYEGRAVSAG